MSTRYEDTQDARQSVDDRERGRALRRDVRETGRDIRDAGGDIINSWCGLWGNLLASFGEAIAPRSRSSRSSRFDDESDDDTSRSFGCGDGEFRISWGRSGERDVEDKGERSTRRTSARYADRDRNVEIEKKS